jgi:hypothetical protein
MEMNYLKNIDDKIQEYVSNLIFKEDKSIINIIINDLNSFISNAIEFLFSQRKKDKNKEKDNIEYDVNIESNNNFKHILIEERIQNTIKIFYRLGLKDHIIEKKGIDRRKIYFRFVISKKLEKKVKLLNVFFKSFLEILNDIN